MAVGQWNASASLMVRQVISAPAQGVTPEGISDPIECADAAARLIRQCEKRLNLKLPVVTVAVHGNHLQAVNTAASVSLRDPQAGITSWDVDRVMEACKTLSLDYDRQILHAFERGFTVDDQSGIKNPVGLYGRKLTAELHMVTALNAGVQNLTRVLNRAGLEVEGMVLPVIAVAEAVLSDLDRDVGVTLVRIGEHQTEVVFFSEGYAREVQLIPAGLLSLSEKLGRALRLPRAAARDLLSGIRTLEELPDQAEKLLMEVKTGEAVRSFEKGQVVEAVHSKLESFLQQIYQAVQANPYFQESVSGIVMVGPPVSWGGFLELAETIFNMPIRLGVPKDLQVDQDIQLTRSHTTVLGLLRYCRKIRQPGIPPWPTSLGLRWLAKGRRILGEYF